MSAIVTNPEDIQRYVREAVVEAVREELPRLVREATRKPFLTKEELKEITGWSDRTIQHLRDTRQIAFVQHGRKILYPTTETEAFLRDHNVPARNRRSRDTSSRGAR